MSQIGKQCMIQKTADFLSGTMKTGRQQNIFKVLKEKNNLHAF